MGKRGPKAVLEVNPELQQRVIDLVRAGNYIETAAEAAGISRQALYRFLRHNDAFAALLHRATAESEARDVALIAKAATDGVWQAAAWRLERRNPRKWGARVQVSVQQELTAVLHRIEATVDEKTFERVLAAIAAGDGGRLALGEGSSEDHPAHD